MWKQDTVEKSFAKTAKLDVYEFTVNLKTASSIHILIWLYIHGQQI